MTERDRSHSRSRNRGTESAAGTKPLVAIGTFASQVAVLTALLYYFGWARTNAMFRYFGVDSSVTGYSATDYVLRSTSPVFDPALILILTALALLAAHQSIVHFLFDAQRTSLAINVASALRASSLALIILVAAIYIFSHTCNAYFEPPPAHRSSDCIRTCVIR